ncbi:MAG TPA: dephospho-CoA kinase [Bacteroidales bacterium]|nr:dephospho-CoA kinase [Bacteroidales bacterium]
MFVLGVTGGIGSGKSTVCKVFSVFGIPVFYSDVVARNIMNTDDELKDQVNQITGTNMYINGELDRPRMAALIFKDDEILQKVNQLVHPLVFDFFRKWSLTQDSKYVILEAAILFEGGADILTDKIVAVTAPFEERIMRVMNRNKLAREQVIERIKSQISENEMVRRSDFLINNAENTIIIPRILEIHNEIMNMINEKE